MKILNAIIALAVTLSAAPRIARAQIIAYSVPAPSTGNQNNFSGPIGMDFDVNAPIQVLQLGVFDSGQIGLTQNITAYIYNRDTGTSLASLVFTPSAPGILTGGSDFLSPASPLTLPAGFDGSIVAENYGGNEPDGNIGLAPNPPASTLNDGGGLISFVGTGRYGFTQGAFPTNLDSGKGVNPYYAGTFTFQAVPATGSPVPEPSAGLLLGIGFLSMGLLIRRKA